MKYRKKSTMVKCKRYKMAGEGLRKLRSFILKHTKSPGVRYKKKKVVRYDFRVVNNQNTPLSRSKSSWLAARELTGDIPGKDKRMYADILAPIHIKGDF
ncbi:hypothetical protein [Domibacillus sp. DTU_2020_1001157_1_SI_ALB_TIR_016]|uniref:hypothetical protein n=1 Tax=Domibacillus sp. DTU_2020_1001157_1_SI_ALB_TIR_016 TaxID=3077789 RepID=UPI0028E60592|nr:hypothetical protein [Domibacillus sp. DTU_2020_1001157_1_SI_ALB_TIR_016]